MLVALALLLSGCAGINPDARYTLQQPMSCEQDAAQLEASRASDMWRFAQGLQGIAPPLAALSLLRDIFVGRPYRSIYLDHWRVAFGSYNEKIDMRVAEIRDICK
jgi:hypothetical protein